MKSNRLSLILFALLFSFGLQAQEAGIKREGLVLGAGIGLGSHFTSDQQLIRYTLPNLRLGFMVNPKLALLVHAPGGTYSYGGETRAFEGIIPTVQYWFSDRFYVNAGAGLGIETTPIYAVDFDEGPPVFNTGLGLFGTIGYDLYQWGGNKAIDVQVRCLYGNINGQAPGNQEHLSFDLVFGINLY